MLKKFDMIKKNNKLVKSRLKEWGYWKRHYISGLDYRSRSIEQCILSDIVYGDGCKGGGRRPDVINNVKICENLRAQVIDRCWRILLKGHQQEMAALLAFYYYEWSIRRIARELGQSRYITSQLVDRGETLIEGLVSYTDE